MTAEVKQLEEEIITTLSSIYDPEIPVNIYDLGLIYEINLDKLPEVSILMTLTSPNCPMTDVIIYQIQNRLMLIEGVENVFVDLTFDPPWDKEMISEEGKLKLGLL
ncbi:MAG: iron-sulfur cluster assembly protein [Bacteroidales bacterium]|jgi:FeS assembly SUF system protein|nr:iron-sulfur cluster assembly protein [Bacteroidales bacterium]